MDPAPQRAWSSIGKKFVSGITGAGLVVFVVMHLAGNLTLLLGPDVFNAYSHSLVTMGSGAVVWIADAGLLLFFGGHIASGVSVWNQRRKARPDGYYKVGYAGGPSMKSRSSLTMVLSGLALLVFVSYHVIHFKFGPAEAEGYTIAVKEESQRDLYRLVVEEFKKPMVTAGYVIAMLFLGLHLRHGFWSMFQSLGANRPSVMPYLVGLGYVVAFLLAVGFVFLPLYILFFVKAPTAATAALGSGVLA